MSQYVALNEGGKAKRRTIADAREVVREELGVSEVTWGQIRLAPLPLPSGTFTATVLVLFPDLNCYVSLPTSGRFKACKDASRQHQVFEISILDGAKVCPDGSVDLGIEQWLPRRNPRCWGTPPVSCRPGRGSFVASRGRVGSCVVRFYRGQVARPLTNDKIALSVTTRAENGMREMI
jgi:hypothetical protein